MERPTNCIFLIDDDAITNTLNTLTLQDIPYCKVIKSFTDSEEALNYINNHKVTELPHVIFIDYNMPLIPATEIIKEIKNISTNIKMVVLTAHVNKTQTTELLNDKLVDDLIFKPLTDEKVMESFKKMELI